MVISRPKWLDRNPQPTPELSRLQAALIAVLDYIITDPGTPGIIRQVGSALRPSALAKVSEQSDAQIIETLTNIQDRITELITLADDGNDRPN